MHEKSLAGPPEARAAGAGTDLEASRNYGKEVNIMCDARKVVMRGAAALCAAALLAGCAGGLEKLRGAASLNVATPEESKPAAQGPDTGTLKPPAMLPEAAAVP